MTDVQVLNDRFRKQCVVSTDRYGYETRPDTDKYGYGDASPDSAYGYGDAAPDSADKYGYGDATPTAGDLGYGDAAPDSATDYGYGDAQPDSDLGYGDGAPDDTRNAPLRSCSSHSTNSRRERPRRRGSVTKYSLDTADEVKKEYDEHSEALNHLRNGGTIDSISVPLKSSNDDANQGYRQRSGSEDRSIDETGSSDGSLNDTSGKKEKKKRFGRFRVGRNRSEASSPKD